jgi:hypothetical protein
MKSLTRGHAAAAIGALALITVVTPSASAAVDVTPPQVNMNSGLLMRTGSVLSDSTNNATMPATVTWTAFDDTGITSQSGQFSTYGRTSQSYYPSFGPGVRKYAVPAVPVSSGALDAYLYANDAAGNQGSDSGYFSTQLVQQGAFSLSAGWSSGTCNCWSAGSAVHSSRVGASAQYQFRGDAIAVIGNRAANRGSVNVYVDGRVQSTVYLSGATVSRVVIFQKRFATTSTHTVKLVVASGRVDLDALVVQS